MLSNQRTNLEKGLSQLGLGGAAADGILQKLIRYIEEIELWNPRYKLVADGEDLVNRHVLDSLSGLPGVAALSPRRLADVGSGAGFPGIPLAICLPDTHVCLIEKMGRRAGFLRTLAVVLGLSNVSIIEKPVEDLSAAESDFDVVTFRAWSALDNQVLDSMTRILASGGRVAAYKGRREVVDAELAAVAGRIGPSEILPLTVFGGGEERNLVIFGLIS